jgi:acyl-homoserine lactone acylase PvdQ
LALLSYVVYMGLMYISIAFSVPSLRERHALPITRTFVKWLDLSRIWLFSTQPHDLYFHDDSDPLKADTTPITGQNMSDLMFQQGRRHAADRLYQMEVFRRTARGTLAATMGEKTLSSDRFCRALNFAGLAVDDYDALGKDEQDLLGSYANGVNSVLVDEHFVAHSVDFALSMGTKGYFSTKDRYEYEPWQPTDSLAIARLMYYKWNHDWEDELLQFLVESKVGTEKSKVFQPKLNDNSLSLSEHLQFVPSLGSNVIAVGAEQSSTGSAFLVHDLHDSVSHHSCR